MSTKPAAKDGRISQFKTGGCAGLFTLTGCLVLAATLVHCRADETTALRAPRPLADHPGNIFLEGESVSVLLPENLSAEAIEWRLLDDRRQVLRCSTLPASGTRHRDRLVVGKLEIGWYRVEFGGTNETLRAWTTLAVLGRWSAPVPASSPVAVDTAAAWFAPDDAAQQKRLANLAALAGVSWVRDRARWRDLQPQPGDLTSPPTTYDTSADAHRDAGLQMLQVFHDVPPWARDARGGSGRFAPDLRHVYEFARRSAIRFKGRVAAWEPWNEANVATFGAHTVDQMCSWQKAAWLGFKAGDSEITVGWNATAAVPTPAHTEGVLANETWPYFDTYNIHTYDWSHSYAELWKPAREAAAGRPIWITEADRGTPHRKNPPWFDQDPRLEKLKAEWMAQAYASSLFAGAQRHFHFILGHYHEPNGVQFGLLRLDLTPRPAYVALAAVGRLLADAHILGRWQPGGHVQVYAFRARPDGREHDVLVAWAEKEVDWEGRGSTTADWKLPENLNVERVVDYLGRPAGKNFRAPLTSAPVFVVLAAGEAGKLPLQPPPPLSPRRDGMASPIVLQIMLPPSAQRKVEDLPWSEGYAYRMKAGELLELKLYAYNFATNPAAGRLELVLQPPGWEMKVSEAGFHLGAFERKELAGSVRVPEEAVTRDGWVVLRANCAGLGQPKLAFRILVDR